LSEIVSLYLPFWPTDRIRRRLGADAPAPEAALALVGRAGRRRVVRSVDLVARKAGLCPGTLVAKAQALYPDLTIMDADPQGTARGWKNWPCGSSAAWLLSWPSTRRMALCWIRRGPITCMGASRPCWRRWSSGCGAPGSRPRQPLPIVSGPPMRWRATGGRGCWSSPPGEAAAAMADLPIAALRLPDDIVDGLHALGVSRIGPLAGMPRAPLALRFGPDVARRLDQAFGRVAEAIVPIRPVEPVEVSRNFAEPIGAAETIARMIGTLVPPLCQLLEERGQVAGVSTCCCTA
jgi:protein ImuB